MILYNVFMHAIRMCQDGILGYWVPQIEGIKLFECPAGESVRIENHKFNLFDLPDWCYDLSVQCQVLDGNLIKFYNADSRVVPSHPINGSGLSAEQAIDEVERRILTEANLLRNVGSVDDVVVLWHSNWSCLIHEDNSWKAECICSIFGCAAVLQPAV